MWSRRWCVATVLDGRNSRNVRCGCRKWLDLPEIACTVTEISHRTYGQTWWNILLCLSRYRTWWIKRIYHWNENVMPKVDRTSRTEGVPSKPSRERRRWRMLHALPRTIPEDVCTVRIPVLSCCELGEWMTVNWFSGFLLCFAHSTSWTMQCDLPSVDGPVWRHRRQNHFAAQVVAIYT